MLRAPFRGSPWIDDVGKSQARSASPGKPIMAMWRPSNGEGGGWNVRFVSHLHVGCRCSFPRGRRPPASSSHDDPDSLHLLILHNTPASLCCSYRRTLHCSFARSLADSSIVSLSDSHLTVASAAEGQQRQ